MPRKKQLSPADLAAKADAFKAFRERRLELKRELDDLEKQEALFKQELIDHIQDAGVEGVMGKICQVRVTQKTIPIAEDWEAIDNYILEHNALDLLQRRLGVKAVTERWEAGEEVPGVGSDTKLDLSVRKL